MRDDQGSAARRTIKLSQYLKIKTVRRINSRAVPDQSGAKPDEPEKPDKAAKNAPVPAVKLRIEVTNNVDKPVSNASVYVRFSEAGGFLHHDKLAELDLKTNQDGSGQGAGQFLKGKILIQVIATGVAQLRKVVRHRHKDEELVKIKLDPPPHWY